MQYLLPTLGGELQTSHQYKPEKFEFESVDEF